MDFLKNKTNLAILLVVIVVFVIYYLYFSGSSSDQLTVKTTASSSNQIGQQFVSSLFQLQGLSLDGKIFTDADFLSLKDISTPIPPQAVKRNNPFAQIGMDSGSGFLAPVSSSTSSKK